MINKHNIDFLILDDDDTKSFCFLDKSDYFKRPEKPIIEVKFPNMQKIYQLVIESSGFKRLTTKNLHYLKTIQDFPDGVYEVTYSVAPHDKVVKKIKHLRTSFLQKDIKNILNKIDSDSEVISNLYKINLYLQAASLSLNDNEKLAVSFYKEAQKQINNIKDDL
jgi:hypothetical protein